ncbi:segregation and condensation protein A [Alkalimarinus sediminis]|uniref:Segregation and condensation protein A n=1 Tax=Alkalimarinus sediminis TaxID=1632866 RepID=A0A9E8HN16_9ALTE|nr:ScpA family protein [Alkalimarinus sediminis]UZW75931.1 segregation/condensation protein A [Alkalimarinus sediminis]
MTVKIEQSNEVETPHIQQEMIFAFVDGKPVTEIPQDLYIPPDALEVMLETFEGPLDLLLYLIRRQNMDILNVNVSHITKQYMEYITLMKAMRFELAAEYLLMAAMLAEIKSRMLLPRHENDEEDEDDPRAELIRRLQQYERFKQAAEDLDELPRMGRDTYSSKVAPPKLEDRKVYPDLSLQELMIAFSEVLKRSDMFESHQIEKETLSTREKMTYVLGQLSGERFTPFEALFNLQEGRLGVVVTFLAIMELIKEQLVELIQNESFGAIHLKARVQ